ncbi:plasmid mobilization protein [Paraburkholderia sp. A1RO-5L]|uniref:plasmid mobilization protein n=1 Tax=unclassified Paraburkholderia TaxID=2615204 RepID=UPI003B764EFA
MSSSTKSRRARIGLTVRTTCDEHEVLAQKAGDCGLTLSAYLLACALGRATRNVTTSRVLDALVMLGTEQRRIGGLVQNLCEGDILSPGERAALIADIQGAQRAVIDAIRRFDHAGKGSHTTP